MIEEIIPKQGFEIVRDVIGYVLAQELNSQRLKNPTLNEDLTIGVERTYAATNAEEVMVNVCLSSANYSNKEQIGSEGKTFYDIDVYTKGVTSEDETGSYNSANKNHKYLGIARYILQHTKYKTLGLPLGLIAGTMVENFEVNDTSFAQDADSMKMSRLVYSVKIYENQGTWDGINLESYFANIKLDETDLGYLIEKLNN